MTAYTAEKAVASVHHYRQQIASELELERIMTHLWSDYIPHRSSGFAPIDTIRRVQRCIDFFERIR